MHVLYMSTWYPKSSKDLSGSFFREQALALRRTGAKVGAIGAYQRPLTDPIKAVFGSGGIEIEDDNGILTARASSLNFPPRWRPGIYRRTQTLAAALFGTYVKVAGQPDVIHVQSALDAGPAACFLNATFGVPYIVQEHSTLWKTGSFPDWELDLLAKAYDAAARRYTVSSALAREIGRRINLGADFFGVVPNSVSVDFLNAPLRVSMPGKFRFLHLSFLEKKKNVSSLIRAFSMQFRGSDEHVLVIGGDGPEREQLRKLAQALGVASQIRFTGRLSRQQVVAEMQESDAFVLSSRVETFGVVVVEAMAMGLPVIATRCGGPEEILDESTGILVDPDNDEQLANAMLTVSNERNRWDAASLRQICRDRYSPAGIACRWQNIYQDVVDGRQQ